LWHCIIGLCNRLIITLWELWHCKCIVTFTYRNFIELAVTLSMWSSNWDLIERYGWIYRCLWRRDSWWFVCIFLGFFVVFSNWRFRRWLTLLRVFWELYFFFLANRQLIISIFIIGSNGFLIKIIFICTSEWSLILNIFIFMING
jgi:hypothetical protein